LDQPVKAIDNYENGISIHPYETHLLIGIARVHDMLNDPAKAITYYKKVLQYDNSSMEAIACLASYHFYTD
jgi:tetratricopeptide repeat protein 8